MKRTDPRAQGRMAPLSLIPRLLVGLVSLVCRAPKLILFFALTLCALSIYAALTRLEYQTRREDMMSADHRHQKRWRAYLQEFGNDDDLVVVVQGPHRAEMAQGLELLATKIKKHPDSFDRLFYKVDLRRLANRALLFLPEEQIQKIAANLTSPKGLQPLLEVPYAWQAFSLRFLLAEAQGRLKSYNEGSSLRTEDEQFLQDLIAITASATSALHNPDHYHSPWRGRLVQPPDHGSLSEEMLQKPRYLFSDDGQMASLLVRPIGRTKNFLGPHEQVRLLRSLLAEVKAEHPELQMGLTGLPVLEHDEMEASQNDTRRSSWFALLGVTLLYFLVFRSWRWPFYTVMTLVIGALWTLGWLTVTVGHLNMLSATFAVMLIGMGDYGILWVARYHQERDRDELADLPRRERIHEAIRASAITVGPSILTASITTGLAFFATMLAEFQGMAELGWIAGFGVLFCAISCFTVLPALLVLLDRPAAASEPRTTVPFPQDCVPWSYRRSWCVLGGGLALTVALAFFAIRVQYDQNLLNLQAKGLPSVQWQEKLLAHSSGAGWHALSYRRSREEALAIKEKLEQLPEVERVVGVASLIPGNRAEQREKVQKLRAIQRALSKLPPRDKPIRRLWGMEEMPKEQASGLLHLIHRLKSQMASKDQPLFAKLHAQLGKLQKAMAAGPDTARRRLMAFEAKMVSDLLKQLHQLRDSSYPAPITIEDLPASLRERYLSPNGQWLLRVFGRENLWEQDVLKRFTTAVQKVDPRATGEPFTFQEGLETMKTSFQWAGAYSIVAIVIVLLVDFRAWKPTCATLFPLVIGSTLCLGLLTLVGWELNPANLIALPLLVGVGVDNGVHVVHDYFTCRKLAAPYRLSSATCKGILVAGLTTMLGFGALMLSHHRGLASMGALLTVGVGCCMLAALVLLPALLHLWSLRKPEKRAQPSFKPVRSQCA